MWSKGKNIKVFRMKNKKISKEELWCEYSDMPSPMAYARCCDYDSMGNHGRYPKVKRKETGKLVKNIKKLINRFLIKPKVKTK